MTYAEWIREHVQSDGYGQCAELTEQMARAFPELKRVRGHYYDICWGERAHWWLVTPDGYIVDPTAAQFPTKGRGHYDPWDESEHEPTGKCINCGGYVLDGSSCCSDECAAEAESYITAARKGDC